MRLTGPGRLELGTEGGDQQDRQAVDPRESEVEELARGRIDPVQILEDQLDISYETVRRWVLKLGLVLPDRS